MEKLHLSLELTLPCIIATQEEAAEAYDIAAIKFRGLNAITNFEMSRYDVKSILESSNLPIGPAARRLKEASSDSGNISSQLTEGINSYGWPGTIAFQQKQQPLAIQYPYSYQHSWFKQEEDCNAMAAHCLHEINSFQQPIIHNAIASCSTSLQLGTGLNSDVYNGGFGELVQANSGSGRSCFGDEGKQHSGVSYVQGWSDYYRNGYYPLGVVKANDYERSSDCSDLTAASAQGIPQMHTNMAVGQGAPLFTAWDES